MYILNITFNIEVNALVQWKKFMETVFMPFSHSQGNFAGQNFYEVMVEDENTETYSFQLIAKEEKYIDDYIEEIFPALSRELSQSFGDKVMLFQTKLRETKLGIEK
jgi:hypothetical protein